MFHTVDSFAGEVRMAFTVRDGLEPIAHVRFHPGAAHQKHVVAVVLHVKDCGARHGQASSSRSIMTASEVVVIFHAAG